MRYNSRMQTIEDLKKYLCRQFSDTKIWLFGSRARGTATPFSDIDIAVEMSESEADGLTMARFEIEESLIPQKVDLVDLKQAPYLKEIARRVGIRWQWGIKANKR